MVFDWIAGGKVDHPMAEVKEARRIVAALPEDDPSRALEEITRWLESLRAVETFKLNRRLENIDLLDGAAGRHQRRLLQEYLATPRHKKSDEHRLWTDVFSFWRELGEGYLQCLQCYEAGPARAGSFRESLPLVVSRALRALRQQLKWILLRYGLVEARIWSDVSRLYRFAEARGFADHAVAAPAGAAGGSSVRQEFLKALMLPASSTDSLHPVAQDLASRLVAHFSRTFIIAVEPRQGCTHWFDLAAPKVPARVVGVPPTGATVRFFGAGPGLHELEQLKAHIAYTRSLPADLKLPDEPDSDALMNVLKHLEQNWSGKTQARRFERRKVTTRVTVVPGLSGIIQVLEFAVNDSLDFSHQQSAESWIIEDLSEGGYGAVIPAVAGDWVEVGSLIGVEGETFRNWRVGVIRRVTRNEQQQQRVGVQLFTQSAALARLREAAASTGGSEAAERPASAVLLAPTPAGREEVDILVRKGTLDGEDRFEVRVSGETYLLNRVETAEHGEDYDRIRFKVDRRSR